jgi:prevent-host-death family protein
MTSIDVYDAKTQLPRLLDRVGRGERFLITRVGRPVAQLIPATIDSPPDVHDTVQAMEAWQQAEGPTLGPNLTIRGLREQGRPG